MRPYCSLKALDEFIQVSILQDYVTLTSPVASNVYNTFLKSVIAYEHT